MKTIKITFILFFILTNSMMVLGQKNPYWQEPKVGQADSLKSWLESTKDDSMKLYINRQLGLYYQERNRFIAFDYFNAQLELARKLNQKVWEAEALSRLGYVSSSSQNYPGALNYLLAARKIASDPDASLNLCKISLLTDDGDANSARMTVLLEIINHLGILNNFVGNYEKAIDYYEEASELNKIRQDEVTASLLHMNKGEAYVGLGKYDLAKTELEQALSEAQSSGYNLYTGLIYWDIGRIYETEGNFEEAEKYYKLSITTNIDIDSPDFLGMGYLALAELYKKTSSLDSSYHLAHKALSTYRAMSDSLGMINAHSTLASLFDARSQIDSAYYYMKEGATLNSAMNKDERVKEFQVLGLNEQLKLNELETEKVLLQSRIRIYGLTAGIGVFFLISILTYKNNIRQKKDKTIIENSYAKLKSTQSQLIQQEKLASLGQLTAGIAHEIKNPLNFVNNFSELSSELIDEAFEELEKLESSEEKEEIIAILQDVKGNLTKVHEHGTRANGIVTSMLQHSRGGDGKMEPTDLNALLKEYVNLSFHGMRAGKNPIDVDIILDLDPEIKEVPLIKEDFTRVIINLCNNAFDACAERSRSACAERSRSARGNSKTEDRRPETEESQNNEANYLPKLMVKSTLREDKVMITIEDNGPGFPEEIKDKILQPFFTTKKGTEGTGLGLSITNDIIKAHGGELEAQSEPGNTVFRIMLPV
ncbi:Tetratricopeptide repeat-containing protein [Algoriphagus faecimaris]|uniref:histidine kinase n=1 Tax=Algoriphagus faecimaris TaxID=686796 RepID=A0A1G6Q5S8_9BACT|nr:tetratricopeptide repeat protein [Algoriphagus faecimaris]SDC87668.1 Tetratricopeptide repeat-containing protein [Algoriphagus faecimaris]